MMWKLRPLFITKMQLNRPRTDMDEVKHTLILAAVDECIEQFIAERRGQVKTFVAEHFSLQQTILIQKNTFFIDLISNPVNALWAIPYLFAKKIVESIDKLGLSSLHTFLLWVPSGIKTGYQKKIENLVATEFLGWSSNSKNSKGGLSDIMKRHSALSALLNSNDSAMFSSDAEFRLVLNRYCASRALISDLSGSLLAFFVGWNYFGDKSLGILGMGDRIAHRMAKDKAAGNFFLGKNIGSSFYNVFPPQPTQQQVFWATLFLGVLLTVFSLIVTALSDPALKKLGLQEKKLNALLDDLEITLLIQFKRKIKGLVLAPVA